MNKFGAKEWTMIFDAVCSLAVYFVGKYFNVAVEDLKFVIGVLQPIVGLLLVAFTVENVQKIKAGLLK